MSDQPAKAPADAESDEQEHPDAGPGAEQDVVPDEADAQTRARAEAARQRRLDEVFGSGEHHGGGKGDAWYRGEVPPHHG